MPPRRRLTDADRLAEKIAKVIRSSKCADIGVVDALLAVAAGRAAVSETHDCEAFEDRAHNLYHAATFVLGHRQKRDHVAN